MEKVIEKRLSRTEVPEALTWNLEDLYDSQADWEKELAAIEQDAAELAEFQGTLGNSAASLLACLEAEEHLSKKLVRAGTYISLLQSADGTCPDNQANSSLFAALLSGVQGKTSFIESELLSLPEETIEAFMKEENRLQPFSRKLQELGELRPHRLSEETERVLASLGEIHGAPYKIYQNAKLADMTFESVEDEDGNLLSNSFALYEDRYEFSSNTYVRRKAYDSFVSTLKNYKNTVASAYAAEVKNR